MSSQPNSAETARRNSPLVQCVKDELANDVIGLAERPFLGHLNLRGDFNSLNPSVKQVFGVDLPEQANTVSVEGAGIALWTGPDEWLLIHRSDEDADRVADLDRLTADAHVSVVDVSSAQTVIYVSGTHARDVLARGCPLDLHSRVFGTGQCAQTHFGHIPVTVWLDNARPDPIANPGFNVVVRRSFADYLWRLLDDAATGVRAAV